MQRREVLALLGGALGLAASGPALAAPVTGLDVFDEHDVPGRMARVRTQLDAIRARPVSPEMQEYLATTGLPADIIGRTMGALAATAAFRELDQHAQAHPEAQALLDDEAPHAGAVAGAWSGFLHHQHNVRGVTEALRERPELGLDLREKLQQAAAQLGMPERWVEVLDHHVESVHWRMRHQSASVEATNAVASVDGLWHASGLDPDEIRAAASDDVVATSDPDTAATGGDQESAGHSRHSHGLKTAGAIVMGVGGGLATLAIIGGVALPNPGSVTALVVLGIPGLVCLLVGFMLWVIGKSGESGA